MIKRRFIVSYIYMGDGGHSYGHVTIEHNGLLPFSVINENVREHNGNQKYVIISVSEIAPTTEEETDIKLEML